MAQQVGLEYVPLPVRDAGEIESALRSLTPVREHVLLVNIDELMFANFVSTAALARTLRLPSGSEHQAYVQAGGLFSYGPDQKAMWLRAVQMADQVLRGQPVGEIAIRAADAHHPHAQSNDRRRHGSGAAPRAAAEGGRGDRVSAAVER